MLATLSLLLFSLFIHDSSAVTYYISPSRGSTARNANGRSPATAYASMRQMNAQLAGGAVNPGDTILLCQGDKFMFETIWANAAGTPTAPVTWGSYKCRDSDDKPIVSPAFTLPYQKFQRDGNYIVYEMGGDQNAPIYGVRAVWLGEVRHLTARWPNLRSTYDATLSNESEFLFHNGGEVNGNYLNNSALTQPNNYWVGATVYMRTSNWLYQQAQIVASGRGWIRVDGAPGRVSGFYMEQNLIPQQFSRGPLLYPDMPGEFVYNRSHLVIYPIDARHREGLMDNTIPLVCLYGSTQPAMVITQPYNIIQDIEFKWTLSGISNAQRGKFTALRNTVRHAVGWGIQSGSAAGSIVKENKVYNAEADCIILDSQWGIIEGNEVDGCGLIAGYGFSMGAASTGIVSMNSDIINNKIRNTGYSGITPHAVRNVRNNHISNVMKTLNDGGGIYMFGTAGSQTVIEGNIIENIVGNYLPWTPWNIASCVFTDQGTSGISIYNNSCYSTPQCMQLNSAYGNMILGNRCDSPGIYINDFVGNKGLPVGRHGVMGNVMVSRGTNARLQNPIYRIKSPGNTNLFPVATFAYNRYCEATRDPDTTGYLFQTDFGPDMVNRFDNFSHWKNHECAKNVYGASCTFEIESFSRYNGCNTVRPYLFTGDYSELRALGQQILAEERADFIKKVVGGTVGGFAGLALIITAIVFFVRRNKQDSLSLPTSSPSNLSPSFRTLDSPATGEFELAVTPEMKRGFSWSDSTIQSSSQ